MAIKKLFLIILKLESSSNCNDNKLNDEVYLVSQISFTLQKELTHLISGINHKLKDFIIRINNNSKNLNSDINLNSDTENQKSNISKPIEEVVVENELEKVKVIKIAPIKQNLDKLKLFFYKMFQIILENVFNTYENYLTKPERCFLSAFEKPTFNC